MGYSDTFYANSRMRGASLTSRSQGLVSLSLSIRDSNNSYTSPSPAGSHPVEGSVAKIVFDVKNEAILCAEKTIIVYFTGIFSSATR